MIKDFKIGWVYWIEPKDGYLIIKINDDIFREDDKHEIEQISTKLQRFLNGQLNWSAKDTVEFLAL